MHLALLFTSPAPAYTIQASKHFFPNAFISFLSVLKNSSFLTLESQKGWLKLMIRNVVKMGLPVVCLRRAITCSFLSVQKPVEDLIMNRPISGKCI